MQKSKKEFIMAHGPSRALTRGPGESLVQGRSSVNKLLEQMFSLKNTKNTKKFSLCKNKLCKTCPFAAREQIEDNKDLFCKCFNVIYLLECLECNLCYVGQTSTPLNIRLNGHRSNINNSEKKESNEYELLHFQIHSFDNIKIYILYEEENVEKRLDLENIFICQMNTLFPYGLNSKLNSEGILDTEYVCIYKKFKVFNSNFFSDIQTKFRGRRGKNKNKTNLIIEDLFKEISMLYINWINVIKIRKVIFGLRNNTLKWYIKNGLFDLKFISTFTRVIVFDLIKFKLNINYLNIDNFKITENKDYCVINYQDKIFDCLKIPSVFHNNLEIFPIKEKTSVSIAFKFGKTLRGLICNYNHFSQNLEDIKDSDCICKQEFYSKFIDKQFGHVLAGELDIIKHEPLRNLLEKGSKFRLRIYTNLNNKLASLNKDIYISILLKYLENIIGQLKVYRMKNYVT